MFLFIKNYITVGVMSNDEVLPGIEFNDVMGDEEGAFISSRKGNVGEVIVTAAVLCKYYIVGTRAIAKIHESLPTGG